MDKLRKWAAAAAAACVSVVSLAAVGCGGETEARGGQARTEAVRKAPFVVRVQESGRLEALISVDVKSNVEGEILTLNVEDGDNVSAGDILIEIDPKQVDEEVNQASANYEASLAQLEQAKEQTRVTQRRLDAELQQAIENVRSSQAALESSKQSTITQVAQAETGISTSEDGLARDQIALSQAEITLQQYQINMNQLQTSLASAQLAHTNAQNELKRNQELYEKKYVSLSVLEAAQERESSVKTSLESAQRNLENQKKAVESQKASIEAQKRVIQSSQTRLEFEKANLEILKTSRDASERQAEANLASAKSRLDEIQSNIEAEKKVAALSEKTAQASVLRNKSALETANQRKGWTTLSAPIAGTVTNLVIEQGEIVTSGRSAFAQTPPLMTIEDLKQMIVRVGVNEVDMGQMGVGQRAEISVDAYPNKKFKGEVRRIAPSGQSVDNIVRFEVEVQLIGSPKELLPGMTANVDIFVVDMQDVLQAPLEAVSKTDTFGIRAELKPEERSKLKVGDAVTVETQMGKAVEARVDSMEGGEARFVLMGESRGWRAGSVNMTVVTPAGETLKSLSGQITRAEAHFVEVADGAAPSAGEKGRGGKPSGNGSGGKGGEPNASAGQKTPVRVGLKNEGFYEILSGVQEGQMVVIRPPQPQDMQWRR